MTIFLSQRPNLDPKPWRSVASGIRYRQEPDDGFGPYVFDPRPEFEPTRDPEPWLSVRGYRYADEGLASYWGPGYAWSPRRDKYDTANPTGNDK